MATKANLFNDSVKKSNSATVGKDKGVINKTAETSMVSRANGSTTINSGIYAQLKCDKSSGVVTELALQSVVNAVQRELSISDLIINRHKFNFQLFEFTNLKKNMETIMGDLTVNATILVKTYEPNLGQYVLIRRPARFPVFSHLLDAYTVDERLEITGDMSEDLLGIMRDLNNLSEDTPTEEGATEENTSEEDIPSEEYAPVDPNNPLKEPLVDSNLREPFPTKPTS